MHRLCVSTMLADRSPRLADARRVSPSAEHLRIQPNVRENLKTESEFFAGLESLNPRVLYQSFVSHEYIEAFGRFCAIVAIHDSNESLKFHILSLLQNWES